MSSLEIFLPNILASIVAAMALSLIGSLLAARKESLQALVASQSASFGVTLSLAFSLIVFGHIEFQQLWTAFSAFVSAVLVFVFSQKICQHFRSKTTEVLLSVFLFVIALNYLMTAFFPALDQHFSAAFLGDIATASIKNSYILMVLSGFVAIFLISNYRKLVHEAFWSFGANIHVPKGFNFFFYFLSACVIVESTRVFGFLFSTSSLLCVPLGASIATKSLKSFKQSILILSSISTLIGFGVSLCLENISTSAAIVVMQIMFSVIAVYLKYNK